MNKDLTTGNVTKTMLIFAGPMIAGNLLQQFYNIADTLIVGKFLGAEAMAAVGTAYTLMSFLTSILIGLCMGSGSVFSFYYGKKDILKMQDCIRAAFFYDWRDYDCGECSVLFADRPDSSPAPDSERADGHDADVCADYFCRYFLCFPI